jgi:hypothetical protein
VVDEALLTGDVGAVESHRIQPQPLLDQLLMVDIH